MQTRSGLIVALSAIIAPLAIGVVSEPVRIDTGWISGGSGRSAGIRVYKGIPFAAPPIGDLRWQPPKAPVPWNSVRKADQFSQACVQDTTPGRGPKLLHDGTTAPTSEDCLYLNVWTGAKSVGERLPVIVFFHGGGLVAGSAVERLYDGEALARKGVVMVTTNYRVGALGFLAHPELSKESGNRISGNYGFLDQIAALQWVQRNIAAFGGDPKKVTIMGQSGGSRSVNVLMATPLAKGLFRGVISQSHAYFNEVPTLAEAEKAGLKFAQTMGATSLAELRAKPADEIVKAQARMQWNANVDGWCLPADIYTIFSTGKQNDVALLVGSNSDEASGFSKPVTARAYTAEVRQRYGDQAAAFLKLYPAGSDEEANKNRILSQTDQSSSYHAWIWARLQGKTGKSKAYLYRFSHRPPVAGSDAQVYNDVFHGAELYYVFGQYGFKPEWAWTDADRKYGEMMSSYWVNFAGTRDPNGKGLPKWSAYDEKLDELMNFADRAAFEPVPRKAALEFFESYFHPAGGSPPRNTATE